MVFLWSRSSQGFLLDRELSFKAHIDQLISKLKVKLGFFYRNKASFIPQSQETKYLQCFCLSLICFCLSLIMVMYNMCSSSKCLQSMNSVYHCALRYVTARSHLTHCCECYVKSDWPSLRVRRYTRWLILVYKALLGLVPAYLSMLVQRTKRRYALPSCNVRHQTVPLVRTEMENKAFVFATPSAWNLLV